MRHSPYTWIDPWATIDTHREALAMERRAYDLCAADRRQLTEALREAQDKLERYQVATMEVLPAVESLMRPYLKTAAIWGITPSTEWRNREMDPVNLSHRIAAYIATLKLTPE
jgi:uncharacterized membrane protein